MFSFSRKVSAKFHAENLINIGIINNVGNSLCGGEHNAVFNMLRSGDTNDDDKHVIEPVLITSELLRSHKSTIF